jgi:hypothetical protein
MSTPTPLIDNIDRYNKNKGSNEPAPFIALNQGPAATRYVAERMGTSVQELTSCLHELIRPGNPCRLMEDHLWG